ncbi:MAG: hypothetical protein ACOYLX_18250 [Burkholderiaceae bacterium]
MTDALELLRAEVAVLRGPTAPDAMAAKFEANAAAEEAAPW